MLRVFVTIEDVVYMGMKNDISFWVKDILNLYEHQSTFSSNLHLRGLFYFADLYRKLIGHKKDIYSSKLIRLPYPQFVIFYNGTQDEPKHQVLQLHDAFPEWSNREEAALQCKAVVLNINLRYNVGRHYTRQSAHELQRDSMHILKVNGR